MNEQLLLVEDDDAIADVLGQHLSSAGYSVQREFNGAHAMRRIHQKRWDMVLLDLTLPGADGWDVCSYLRRQHPDVPVIMISARSTEAHRVHGLELGADDYLAKPFSMLELVARVRALFRRAEQAKTKPAPSSYMTFGDYCLDSKKRELSRQGQIIALTMREFELLSFLLRNPGRAYSRGELIEQVWGDSFDGYEHTVNSHINRLRTKIEGEAKTPHFIVTVWGVGYRFDLPSAAP